MKRERIVYIDLIKIISIFGVILSHSMTGILATTKFTFKWNLANILVQIISPGVGLFFMVSGALILTSDNSTSLKYLFSHRLVKVGVPFLIWAAITVGLTYRENGIINFWIWLKKMLLIYHQLSSKS